MKKILPIVVLILSLLVLPAISAAVTYAGTMVSPVKYGNYTGTLMFNASAQLVNSTDVQYNATLICNSSGGTAQAFVGADIVNLGVVTNKTTTTPSEKAEYLSKSITISSLTDLMTYNCSAYIDNGTDQEWGLNQGKAGITFDSTSPVCTVSVPQTNIPSNGYQVITYSITDALSLVANSASVTGPTGFTTLSYTDATGAKQVNGENFIGSWAFSSSGTDRAGNTCAGSQAYTTYNNNGGVATLPAGTLTGGSKPNTKLIAFVVLVAIGLFVYFKKKG